ncbi:hypothetical protein [Caballeronia novacaledonica]|nr:hypothetical protein [Caballeronia novacaledonica]
MKKDAETTSRAVEAARGWWGRRPRLREPRLSAPASGGAAVLESDRISNSILTTVAMGGVVLGACFLIRAYIEQHPSTPRAGALPVAVAGSVGEQARAATKSSVEKASPVMTVAASSENRDTRPVVVPERPVAAKPPATRAQDSSKATSKAASKPAAACAHKTSRACAVQPQRRVAAAEPKRRQTSKSSKTPPVAQAKTTSTKDFQKVAAIPAPVKPAMTADGSWKPSRSKN